MSHSTTQESKPSVSSSAAFWLALLIVFLLVSTINFVRVASSHDDGHGAAHHTEAVQGHGEGGHH